MQNTSITRYKRSQGRPAKDPETISINEMCEEKIAKLGDRFSIIKQKYGDLTRNQMLDFAEKMKKEHNIKIKYATKRNLTRFLIWICENYENLAPYLESLVSTSSSPTIGIITEASKSNESNEKDDNNDYDGNTCYVMDDTEFTEFQEIQGVF